MTGKPLTTPSAGRGLTWSLLILAALASVWLARRSPPRVAALRAEVELMSLVPPGPQLLLTADVESLGSVAATELLRAGGVMLGLRELCGFEPALALRRVALAMPLGQPGQASDFALIAETSLSQEPALRCAEAVIRKRGGVPIRSSLGPFTSVRDQAKPLGEVAIRADGVFVLSGGQYFRDVIDAANGARGGDEAARLRTQAHDAIRQKLRPNQLAVSMLDGPGFPLRGVQAFGLALNVSRELELRGLIACYSVAGCGEAQYFIEKSKLEAAKEPGLAGLAQLRLTQHDTQLEVSARLPREQLGPLLNQLLSP